MTIKGVDRDVSAKVDVQRAGDTIIAVGSVPVTWTDFNVTPPDLGFRQGRANRAASSSWSTWPRSNETQDRISSA